MTVNVHSAIAPTGQKGQQLHSLVEGDLPTYSASLAGVAGLAGTDNVIITGSATAVIRITRWSISGFCTAGSDVTINLVKRSNANTGGTTGNASAQTHDSTSAAASTFAQTYIVAATTLGLSTGTPVRTASVFLPAANSAPGYVQSWDFGSGPRQTIVLRGVAQSLCMNLLTAPAGTLLNVDIEWTESPT
jgi:hypothetical protein